MYTPFVQPSRSSNECPFLRFDHLTGTRNLAEGCINLAEGGRRKSALTHFARAHLAGVGEVSAETSEGGAGDKRGVPLVGGARGDAKFVCHEGNKSAQAHIVGINAEPRAARPTVVREHLAVELIHVEGAFVMEVFVGVLSHHKGKEDHERGVVEDGQDGGVEAGTK